MFNIAREKRECVRNRERDRGKAKERWTEIMESGKVCEIESKREREREREREIVCVCV